MWGLYGKFLITRYVGKGFSFFIRLDATPSHVLSVEVICYDGKDIGVEKRWDTGQVRLRGK